MILILFTILGVAAVVFLIYLFIRDRRYLKKPTREALGDDLRKEIEREKRLFETNKARFDDALEKAKKKLIVKSET